MEVGGGRETPQRATMAHCGSVVLASEVEGRLNESINVKTPVKIFKLKYVSKRKDLGEKNEHGCVLLIAFAIACHNYIYLPCCIPIFNSQGERNLDTQGIV